MKLSGKIKKNTATLNKKVKNLNDNKSFWKTIKSYFFFQSASLEQINFKWKRKFDF